MIIEIALGIVLAVLILMFFDVILGFALIAIGIAILLAIAGALIYLAVTYPEQFFAFLAIGAVVFAVIYWDTRAPAKRVQTEARLYESGRYFGKLLGKLFPTRGKH